MSSGEETESVVADLGERPDADKLQRAVARARVAAKLFAQPPEQVKLGRYHLLEMVGAGGMGVVWGAWDPELDRRVAIKLVRTELAAARERILVEGQALAKLSHPNVVPVYDVGIVEDQVYLVMEWVRGKNLRAWCTEPRTVRAIVDVYRAAGEGLGAAHRVGLIHRDFKPDNAMIGDDGRVRVLDFGLARGEVRTEEPDPPSELTRGAGTPRYMAPEQADGKDLTPAADQYALGLALREALAGRTADGKPADVPRWLDDIIARATAREAADRFPSIDDLIRALGRDPATVWRRRLIALGAVGFAGAAFAVGTLRGGIDTCGGGAGEIAKIWNASAAQRIAQHLASLGAYGTEEAKRIVPDLDAYGARWASTHEDVCLANERKELGAQLYDVRLACLARAQVALQTVTEVLARSDKERLPNVIMAARSLPDVDACATETRLSTIEPAPVAIKSVVNALATEVSKVRYLALAVDPDARSVAQDLAARAKQLGYAPLVGRAHLAHALGILGDGKGGRDALPELARARSTALRAGDLATAIEAYAREVYVNSLGGAHFTKSLDVGATRPVFEDLAHGTKAEGAFERGLLLNNLGTERMAAGDYAGARAYFEQARVENRGKKYVELLAVSGNLAMVSADPVQRRALFAEEHADLSRVLGANHPFAVGARLRAAQYLDRPDEAAQALRDACATLVRWHPDSQRRIDTCSYELGLLAAERGDTGELRSAFARVKLQPNYRKIADAYLAIADGKPAEAIAPMQELAGTLAAKPSWIDRLIASDALLVMARADELLGDRARAVATLERALALLGGDGFNKAASYYQRRLARARAALAKLSPPETAKHLAEEAVRWYRAVGGYETAIAELAPLTGSR